MKAAPTSWRSLAELDPARASSILRKGEFPAPWDDSISRRSFFKFMGASAALAGLSGCTREPIRPIVPYVKQPEELIPGRALHYATAMPFNGFATGLLVESHEGHPTKIEGNPSHPSSLGATGIFHQAALLDLYDPDRAKTVINGGQISTWAAFSAAAHGPLRQPRLRILTQSLTSPTVTAQLEEILRQYPQARWHQYQPFHRDNERAASQHLFGRPIETRWHIDRARVVLSLDCDFLFIHPESLALTRQFASRRQPGADMIRLYVTEPTPSLTGSMADHRWPMSSAQISALAATLLDEHTQTALAQDLRAHPGTSIVMAGPSQPPEVHQLVHHLNAKLGNIGRTVEYADSAEPHWISHQSSLTELVRDLNAGSVDALLILDGNPVFDSSPALRFGDAVRRAPFQAHISTEFNETSAACQWHLPESHFLEAWGDARAFDGTASIIQPLIAPLYDTKSATEILNWVLHEEWHSDYDLVRSHWQAEEEAWRQYLHEGVIPNSQLPAIPLSPSPGTPIIISKSPALEICVRPDPTLWDGRFANNAWLQELPKPFSKVVWDNPALISLGLAHKYNLENGDVVELRSDGHTVKVPVWITPGQADFAITLHPGGGRTRVGRIGQQIGVDCYALADGATVELFKTGHRHELVSTQEHHSVEGRDIVRHAGLAAFMADPSAAARGRESAPKREDTLYNVGEFDNTGHAWGMVIDLNTCIGCNACTIACQAENNIPVVGRQQVSMGRDMAWIRIDQYFEGAPSQPRVYHQPVPCMHCENAPCELVCPVGATVHDHEGLNLQVYNRCVGTRYCSNNCPYKVRRFNFFRYSDDETPSLKPMRNPNVTVRWRGVMEKCTYCIQRINVARIDSELQNRPLRDGEIKTACQQVCPSRAITFGDIHDPASAVAKAKADSRNYAMLGELNTRPRTTYLARIHNTNPNLEKPS